MSAIEEVINELKPVLGDRISDGQGVRTQHSEDFSHFEPVMPDAVAFPESTEEVQAIARACDRHGVPMVPFGVGTSLEGNVLAREGGVTIDLGRMNRILEVNEADLDVTVEPGVTRKQLNSYLRDMSLDSPLQDQIDYTNSPEVVSTDLVGSRYAGVVDSLATIVQGNRCVLYVWYDNEYGYSHQVVRLVEMLSGMKLEHWPQ